MFALHKEINYVNIVYEKIIPGGKSVMKGDVKILTIKEIKRGRRGQIEIVFNQKSEKPYLTRDAGQYAEGMKVKLHKGKLTPVRE